MSDVLPFLKDWLIHTGPLAVPLLHVEQAWRVLWCAHDPQYDGNGTYRCRKCGITQ